MLLKSLFCILGVIVVKVNWRDKTYTGSLMDMEQYPWATPKYVVSLSFIYNSLLVISEFTFPHLFLKTVYFDDITVNLIEIYCSKYSAL